MVIYNLVMTALGRSLGPAATRASDSDREEVAAELRQHHAEGRLSLAELEERLGAAFSARTLGELSSILGDLPQPPPPSPPPPTLWQRLRPRTGYLVGAVVLAGVLAAVIAGAMGGGSHPHEGFSFSVPFIFFGFFWLRRGRRGWSHSRHGWRSGYPPHDQG